MPTKAQLIDDIVSLNPSAHPEWLDDFEPDALGRYLDHLRQARVPRGPRAFWLRDAETTAVVTRRRTG